MCSRCVRFTREVSGTAELQIINQVLPAVTGVADMQQVQFLDHLQKALFFAKR